MDEYVHLINEEYAFRSGGATGISESIRSLSIKLCTEYLTHMVILFLPGGEKN